MNCKATDCFNCPYPDCINPAPPRVLTQEQKDRINARRGKDVRRTKPPVCAPCADGSGTIRGGCYADIAGHGTGWLSRSHVRIGAPEECEVDMYFSPVIKKALLIRFLCSGFALSRSRMRCL